MLVGLQGGGRSCWVMAPHLRLDPVEAGAGAVHRGPFHQVEGVVAVEAEVHPTRNRPFPQEVVVVAAAQTHQSQQFRAREAGEAVEAGAQPNQSRPCWEVVGEVRRRSRPCLEVVGEVHRRSRP